MRYIKLFEGFNEDKENLRDDISASLVELYDKGFDIQVTISTMNIFVEIKKQESFEDGEFMFDEIEDEVKQLCDYMSEKYSDLEIYYSPETRWNNDSYDSLEEIPEDIIFSDIIAFDLSFTNKSGYFTEKTYESYEQEEDKDWGKDGFETNKEELKKRVENIFLELVDENYLVDVEISFMSISVSIQLNNENVQSFEENKYIDNELVKDYAETFIEYIKERNNNIDSELGLGVRYELNQGQNAMHRKYIYDYYPEPEYNTIAELKIVLGI